MPSLPCCLWRQYQTFRRTVLRTPTLGRTSPSFNAGGVSQPLSTSDFITASLTFASPLPDDFSDVYSGGSSVLTGTLPTPQWDPALLGWNISDQVSTLSSSEGDILNGVLVTTDDAGNIIAWSLEGSSYTLTTGPSYLPPILTQIELTTNWRNGYQGFADGSFFSNYQTAAEWVGEVDGPGSWSAGVESTSAPEPSFTWLLFVVLAILARNQYLSYRFGTDPLLSML